MIPKLIIIGTPHEELTPGKKSPDATLLEYDYGRQLAVRLQKELTMAGENAIVDFLPKNMARFKNTTCWQMNDDQQLYELKCRCAIVNAYCDAYGKDNVIYVSLHVNAAGLGTRWMKARGWCAWTSVGQTKADILAEFLYGAADFYLKDYGKTFTEEDWNNNWSHIRMDKRDGDRDFEKNFYVLHHTNCPAVLTENMFMDNVRDVSWLQSEEGAQALVDLHKKGILDFLAWKRMTEG